jgi:hypothetical protein
MISLDYKYTEADIGTSIRWLGGDGHLKDGETLVIRAINAFGDLIFEGKDDDAAWDAHGENWEFVGDEPELPAVEPELHRLTLEDIITWIRVESQDTEVEPWADVDYVEGYNDGLKDVLKKLDKL